jgi:hypothetical protein
MFIVKSMSISQGVLSKNVFDAAYSLPLELLSFFKKNHSIRKILPFLD